MEINEYAMQLLADEKLRHARLEGARRELVARARRPRPPLRARLGAMLIRLGERLGAGTARGPSRAAPRASHG